MENSTGMANTGRRLFPSRQTLSPKVAEVLRTALSVSQLSYRAAADRIGISHSYLHGLAHGTRCPSKTVARDLITALPFGTQDVAALLAEAAEGHGRDRRWVRGPIVPGELVDL